MVPIDTTAFWSHWLWPFATAIVGLVFAFLVLRQYLHRKKPQQLAWFVGLLFYGLAAAFEAYSEYLGAWSPAVYRLYIVLAAAITGFLGLGTLYLVAKRRLWGDIFLTYLAVFFVLFFYGAMTVELDMAKLVAGVTVGGAPLGPSGTFPRLYSLFFNIPGTIFLLGGAIYSIIKFSVRKEYNYRVKANVLIAAGTLVIAFAGSRARLGNNVGLYPGEMLGSILLLWGFLTAGTLEKGVRAITGRERK